MSTRSRAAVWLVAVAAVLVVLVLGLVVGDLLFDRTTQVMILMIYGTLTGQGSLAPQ